MNNLVVSESSRLFDLTEEAIHCFFLAEEWACQGYAALFSIYHDGLWRDTSESWEAYLSDFVLECRQRDITIVSVETMEQRTRDYVRLAVGLGIPVGDVLAIPPRIANKIASLAVWPRIGSSDYDVEAEGRVVCLSGPVRTNAIQFYGIREDASDKDVLSAIVARLMESESAMSGLSEIGRLVRADQNYSTFAFFVTVDKRRRPSTTCHMTVYRDGDVASAWDGDLGEGGVPDAVLVEYARRLGAKMN